MGASDYEDVKLIQMWGEKNKVSPCFSLRDVIK